MSKRSNRVEIIHLFGRPDVLETTACGAVVCVVSKWLGIGLHLLHPALLKWRLQFPCISFFAVSSVTADRYVFNVISCSSQSEVDVNRHVYRIDC